VDKMQSFTVLCARLHTILCKKIATVNSSLDAVLKMIHIDLVFNIRYWYGIWW